MTETRQWRASVRILPGVVEASPGPSIQLQFPEDFALNVAPWSGCIRSASKLPVTVVKSEKTL